MKLSRIVVSTSGALRQRRISDGDRCPEPRRPASPRASAATMPSGEAMNAAERADDELSFAADVPDAGAEGDARRKGRSAAAERI